MSYFDIFIGLIFLLGAIKGYIKGLIVEIFSFLAFFIGLFISIEMTIPISKAIFEGTAYYQALTVGVFIGLFIVVIILINLFAKIIKKAVDLTFIGFFDNLLGSLAAIFKWAFMISMIIWVMDSVGFSLPQEWTQGSIFYTYVQDLGPIVFNWLADMLPFMKDLIDSLENMGDSKMETYTFLN
ncbi:MAG: CvpA family protein [Cyclobacteriaceae bacterium]